MSTPRIDGLRPAYYNKDEDRYLSVGPTSDFDKWEPVLLLSANGGLDIMTLDATTAAWLLPDFVKLVTDYTRWLEREKEEVA